MKKLFILVFAVLMGMSVQANERIPLDCQRIDSKPVNNYINIIEQDNDFSEAEREQLYAGMVVAVYSFKFWYEKYTEPILFQ